MVASGARSDAVARLDVTRAFHGDPARLCRALAAPGWLGRIVDSPADRPDLIRVETDLALTIRAGADPIVFRKAALVDIRVRAASADGCSGEIGWRAASFAPLFPVFAGRLSIERTRLQLDGVYAPPGGQLGLLIDHTLVHRFAEKTGRWFLDRLLVALDGERSEGAPGA
jgi:hypothetical protein